MTKMLEGCDVSDVQGFPKWDKVKESGIKYAFCKATEGVTFQAKRFKYNWDGIKDAGIIRGAYHFARTINDPIQEAKNFINTVGPVEYGDILVLDTEDKRNVRPTSKFLQWNLDFLNVVEFETGVTPIVYTGGPYFDIHGGVPNKETIQKFLRYPLWLAAYTRKPDIYVPNIWKSVGWTIWQRSGEICAPGDKVLYVPGINVVVDRNQFKGTVDEFKKFAEGLHPVVPFIPDYKSNDAPNSINLPNLVEPEISKDLEPIETPIEEPDIIISVPTKGFLQILINFLKKIFGAK